MNLKEFLYPNWKKILLTIIIIVINAGLFWYASQPQPCSAGICGLSLFDVIFSIFILFLGLVSGFTILLLFGGTLTPMAGILIIISIIYTYFLSCSLIRIYNTRLKKRKEFTLKKIWHRKPKKVRHIKKKMDWKEFLKPNWKKILISLILLIMLFVIILIKSYFHWYIYLFIWPIYPIFLLSQIFMPSQSAGIFSTFIGIPFVLLWIYILSCTTIFVYNEIKAKRIPKKRFLIISSLIFILILLMSLPYEISESERLMFSNGLKVSITDWPEGDYVFGSLKFNISVENLINKDIPNVKILFFTKNSTHDKIYFSDWYVKDVINGGNWTVSKNGEFELGTLNAQSIRTMRISVASWCGHGTEYRIFSIEIKSADSILLKEDIDKIAVCYYS